MSSKVSHFPYIDQHVNSLLTDEREQLGKQNETFESST